MGAVSSNHELKPQEKALRQYRLEEDTHDLLLSILGLSDSSKPRFPVLLKQDTVKIRESLCTYMEAEDLAALPKIKVNKTVTNISGTWIDDGHVFRVSDEGGYTEKLNEIVRNIYPDQDQGSEQLSSHTPVTILLPRRVSADDFQLLHSPSQWDFITIEREDAKTGAESGLGLNSLASNAELYWGLRLFLALKWLGLADTVQTQKNGSKLFQDIMSGIGLGNQIDIIDKQLIRQLTKDAKARENLDDKKHRLESRLLRLCEEPTPETEAAWLKRRAKEKDIQGKIDAISEQMTKRTEMRPVNLETEEFPKSYCHSIPARGDSILARKATGDSFLIPALSLSKKHAIKFTDICLGRAKDNDQRAPLRTTERMRLMLCYLIPMTSGTAITFYVKKQEVKSATKTTGLNSPTLVLPDAWYALASSLKTHAETRKVKAMSDADYDESDQGQNYLSSIFGDFEKKPGERLRVIPFVKDCFQDIDQIFDLTDCKKQPHGKGSAKR